MVVVIKIGTSSITAADGSVDRSAIKDLSAEIAEVKKLGHNIILVTSGAIAAGHPALGITEKVEDTVVLQALSAIGQNRLLSIYDEEFERLDVVAGQVLLTPEDFFHRQHYLHARSVIEKLLDLGVVPIVNENDVVADDEISFGDNDRLAAMVAHLVKADLLVLLTDIEGMFTADPKKEKDASLIAEIAEVDEKLVAAAGKPGTDRSRGGMASKLAAARIASWSGIPVVIAHSKKSNVVRDAVAGEAVGTLFRAKEQRLSARKLWIGFAINSKGWITVDDGAKKAITEKHSSLLSVGITGFEGSFQKGDAVSVQDEAGKTFAKGMSLLSSAELQEAQNSGNSRETINRDDLVVLPS